MHNVTLKVLFMNRHYFSVGQMMSFLYFKLFHESLYLGLQTFFPVPIDDETK